MAPWLGITALTILFNIFKYQVRAGHLFLSYKTPQLFNQKNKNRTNAQIIDLFLQIYKVDTESRDVFVWKDPGHFVSEPVFVARPGNWK